jgi:hypothetical protein
MTAIRRMGFESGMNSRYTQTNVNARREDPLSHPNWEQRTGAPGIAMAGAALILERR